MGPFPALYGGWLCTPPTLIMDNFYADCMRFLPDEEYSKKEDFGFQEGPIKVLTYQSGRQEGTNVVAGNDQLLESGNSAMMPFTVDLAQFSDSGAASMAVYGFATACLALLSF